MPFQRSQTVVAPFVTGYSQEGYSVLNSSDTAKSSRPAKLSACSK